jgi:hypothetical protein
MIGILLMRPLRALTDQNASTVVPAGFTPEWFRLKKEIQKIFEADDESATQRLRGSL